MDFAWLLHAFMHEKPFKVTTTYPFPCMIYSLCRSAGVPIWYVDQIQTPLSTVDIGLIMDEANAFAPRRGTHQEMPPHGENLNDTITHARMATQTAPKPLTLPQWSLSPVEALPLAHFSQPLSPLLSCLRGLRKLEAQMATHLHHIQPWMQRSIAKAEERLERKIVKHTERKIVVVHQRLGAFK